MKVIIAGSRSITDPDLLGECLEQMSHEGWNVIEVVSGGAGGADQLGECWAERCKIPVKQFLPDWGKYGRSAGFRRNREMAEYADAAIVLWDGVSRGAKNMIDLMTTLDKPLIAIRTGAGQEVKE